jgi:hypothetical protein
MIPQPRQESFKHAPRGAISSSLHEGPSLLTGEGLQEQNRRLQQCVRELLIRNQQLRMLLESENASPGLEASH